ncbi:MAG TPA: Na+/H+ antiporter NhaA [Actinomycetota bacterium]|nr:Na+/H+ antiporter NhaA [Actinomycetota bacterium]
MRHRCSPQLRRLAAAGRGARADLVTIAAVAAAVVWANVSPGSYAAIWHAIVPSAHVLGHDLTLRDLVSQGLMVLFFLLVGLEIRREIAGGDLRSWRRASAPLLAAAFGMAVPALLYALIAGATSGGGGWGIPMATDVAFALGALGLVQPGSSRLRVFLLTLAVADDIASIAILILFYSQRVDVALVGVSLACLGAIIALAAVRRRGEARGMWPLVVLGIPAWWALARAGIEPAVLGVAIGVIAPSLARPRSGGDASSGLEWALAPWVTLVVLPAFALANAGVPLTGSVLGSGAAARIFLAVALARFVGKPLGITVGQRVAALGRAPPDRWSIPFRHEVGLGAVASIGLTVPLLIIRAALPAGPLANAAIAGLLAGSLAGGVAGAWLLRIPRPKPSVTRDR